MDASHKLENEVMRRVCVKNLAHKCCTHLKSDSKSRAVFLADRLEIKDAR